MSVNPLVACRECYVEFDLSAQDYCAALCPRCKNSADGHGGA